MHSTIFNQDLLEQSFFIREFATTTGESCVIIKAKVNPSQKNLDKSHDSWIISNLMVG
jgi:hypothetical protein